MSERTARKAGGVHPSDGKRMEQTIKNNTESRGSTDVSERETTMTVTPFMTEAAAAHQQTKAEGENKGAAKIRAEGFVFDGVYSRTVTECFLVREGGKGGGGSDIRESNFSCT